MKFIDIINTNMKISICGIGVVGGAIYNTFLKKNVLVERYDKYKKLGKNSDMLDSDIVFLCLPTLYSEEKKEYDKSSIYETCDYLDKNKYNGIVVIKSTVEPGTCRILNEKYNLIFLHNPEFLSAKTADEDFINQSHIVIGSFNKECKYSMILGNFYKQYWDNIKYSFCIWEESEIMKISVNSFYAVKIQFFNEIYLLSKSFNVDYQTVKDIMLKNGWINHMHTNVPSTDGKLSYGGMCFPKDTNALFQLMTRLNVPAKVLSSTIDERNLMRKDE